MLDFLQSEAFKSGVRKVFWITIAWFIYSNYQFWHDSTVINIYGGGMTKNAWTIYKGSMLSTLLAGIIGGGVLVGAMEKWLRTKPYGQALFYIFLSYTAIWLIIVLLTSSFYAPHESILPFFHSENLKALKVFLASGQYLNGYVTWLIIVLITLIVLMVNDKYGPGIFTAFLLGKYFRPKREERIFMFLDLRSSTTIAEKLGEERYFDFIKKVFSDVTGSIIYNKGEIYQYVGDEIVVSWRMNKGTQNANCIRCFFDIQRTLQQKGPQYIKEFGLKPEFKAGLHHGYVMAGEVGVVKRDIVYSGDVLNTAARIQSKCNEAGVNILLSKFLLDRLSLRPDQYQPQKIGDILLRGKQSTVALYTVGGSAIERLAGRLK